MFPQTLLIFFLISVLRVGESPTREGPGYASGNESDVGNIDFELQAKKGDKFLLCIVLNFKELFISLQPDVQLR